MVAFVWRNCLDGAGVGCCDDFKKWNTTFGGCIWALAGRIVFWWRLAHPEEVQRADSQFFRALAFVSTISYSPYLLHFPFFRIVGAAWKQVFGENPASFLVPLMFSGSAILLAWIFHRLVEAPSRCLVHDLAGEAKPNLPVADTKNSVAAMRAVRARSGNSTLNSGVFPVSV